MDETETLLRSVLRTQASDVAAPADLLARVRGSRRRGGRWLPPLAAAAVVVLLAGVLVSLVGRDRPHPTRHRATAQRPNSLPASWKPISYRGITVFVPPDLVDAANRCVVTGRWYNIIDPSKQQACAPPSRSGGPRLGPPGPDLTVSLSFWSARLEATSSRVIGVHHTHIDGLDAETGIGRVAGRTTGPVTGVLSLTYPGVSVVVDGSSRAAVERVLSKVRVTLVDHLGCAYRQRTAHSNPVPRESTVFVPSDPLSVTSCRYVLFVMGQNLGLTRSVHLGSADARRFAQALDRLPRTSESFVYSDATDQLTFHYPDGSTRVVNIDGEFGAHGFKIASNGRTSVEIGAGQMAHLLGKLR